MSKDFSTVSTVLEELLSEKAGRGAGPALNLKRMLWLRGPLALLVAVLLSIPGAFVAWFLTPARYTASADIRFLASTPRVLTEERRDTPTPYDKFLNTQISLITGNTILSRVVDDPSIRALPWMANMKDPLALLRKVVDVRVQRNSELVTVTCTLSDKDAAKLMLEKTISAYMDYALAAEANAGGEKLSVLTKERDARQMELEGRLRQITELQSNVGIPMIGENALDTREGDQYRESLLKAEEELAKVKSQLADSESRTANLQALQERQRAAPDKPIFETGVEERVNADPRVSTLRQDVARIEANVAQVANRQLQESPQRKEEEKRLATAKANLAQVERTARASVLDSMLAQLAQACDVLSKNVQEAEQRAEKFRQQLAEYTQRVQKATERFAELEELKRKAQETRSLLEEVRREITQLNLERQAPARVQLAAPAWVPEEGPDFTPRLIAVALAVLMSLGVGAGVGVWRELTDQQIRSPQDLVRLTRLPVIATLSHASEDEALGAVDFALLTADHPNSRIAEEFRRVLARLLYPDDCSVEVKTVVVTSPSQGDGKTSLGCNLAIAMAEASRRVLLIDLSSRRPGIESCFKLEPHVGLAELLDGGCTPDEAIRSTAIEHLAVLGPGLETDGLAGQLASREMVRFLEWAEEGFDHVVMDTPPALLMSDVKLIAPLVDAVLVIVGAGISTQGMVRRCLREMEQTGANLVGVVLNGVRGTLGGYLRDNLKLYQAYSGNGGDGKRNGGIRDIKIMDEESAIGLLPYDHKGGAKDA